LFYTQAIHRSFAVTTYKYGKKKLLKWAATYEISVDRNRTWDHSEEGSKRFEEQQASGNVAIQER
jgi:hypothetical protein